MMQDSGDALYWSFYKGVPAISNYVQVLSNSADLVSYYPGVLDPDSAEPVPSEDQKVLNVWNEIGGEAAMSDWVSSLVVHLSVPGQGWFVPLVKPDVLAAPPSDPSDNGGPVEEPTTFWQVVSTADLKRLLNLDQGQAIPDDDTRIWRVYDPDPENSKDPTSSVIRVRTHANILMLIDRRHEADLYSRIHAGVWPLPASVKNQTTPSGQKWADILEEGLINAVQPGAIESRVPLMLYMDNEEIDLVKEPVKLTVDDGDWLLALEEKTLKNLAIGLDAPQELTTGMNTLNHWGAWLIQEETYTQHLDPLIVRILRSLNAWWQAQLEAGGVSDVEAQVLWRNPSTAINRPNSFEEDVTLHEAFVISDAELRASADKGDDAAPDDAEIERRIRIQQALRSSPTREPTADETRNVPDTNPLQAAAQPDLERLARRLSSIDASTLQRLEREAAKQLRRKRQSLLDRIEAAAKKRGMETDDPDTLPMRLGPSVVQELIPGNLAEPDDFDPAPFAAILLAAQQDVSEIGNEYGISRDGEADSDDRSAALTFLLAALAAAVTASLFRRPDLSGEWGIDGAEFVPTDALRRAMDTAGGGAARRLGDDAWEMIGNGKRSLDGMRQAGIETEGFQWIYGTTPRRKFMPHLDLDTFRFARWDDPGLRQTFSGDWIGGEFYHPQDHRGCACTYIRALVPAQVLV